MKIRFLFFVLILGLLTSCKTTPPKDIAYFQDLDAQTQHLISSQINTISSPIIKNNDALFISVTALDMNMAAPFNLPMAAYMTPGEKDVQATNALQTYLVDSEGNINYPVIGKIKLAGLTLNDGIKLITEKVSQYVTNPVVNVDILSFRVSVLGEVNKPGMVEVTNNRISILDAIAAAADLTIYGNRKNVLLIRDNNGKKEFARFDLTSSDIFSSPYFYMQQNDVLIIEPNDSKKKESKYGEADAYRLSVISTVLGTLSVIGSLITVIVTVSNQK